MEIHHISEGPTLLIHKKEKPISYRFVIEYRGKSLQFSVSDTHTRMWSIKYNKLLLPEQLIDRNVTTAFPFPSVHVDTFHLSLSFSHWGKNPQFIQKFTISKSYFVQNSHFQSLILNKNHIYKVSFFT